MVPADGVCAVRSGDVSVEVVAAGGFEQSTILACLGPGLRADRRRAAHTGLEQ